MKKKKDKYFVPVEEERARQEQEAGRWARTAGWARRWDARALGAGGGALGSRRGSRLTHGRTSRGHAGVEQKRGGHAG